MPKTPSDQITVLQDADALVKAWTEYEKVAMHFNDLMMRWRLQAMGGMAALVTISGFVVGGQTDLATRYRAMVILAGLLSFVWIGVAVIDLWYYRRLLKGAVEALLDLEALSSDLKLSTRIEELAETAGKIAPYIFYIFGFIPLAGIVCWAIYNLNSL